MMQPKLRGDTLYVPSPDGTYLMNNQKALTLPGPGTYGWIERLAPHLDGSSTVEELTAGLPPDKRDAVVGLVRFLVDHGFATDAGRDGPHTLTVQEQHVYAAEIAFVDYFHDSACARFERFRTSRAVTIGAGRTGQALVRSALHCGLANLHVIDGDDPEARLPAPTRGRRDERQNVTRVPAPDWSSSGSVRAALGDCDVVLHVDDRTCPQRARMLNQVCLEDGATMVQAVLRADEAWIGPLALRGSARGCWECAWRRLWPRLSDDSLTFAEPGGEPSPFLTGPPAALIANHLVFEVFKALTGAGPSETVGGLVRLDLETLSTDGHRVVPHPLCAGGHGAVDTDPVPATGAAAGDEDFFVVAVARLFDPMVGVFSEVAERDAVQLPLKVSQVVLPDPATGQRLVVHGDGSTVREARLLATRRACERYAAGTVDPGRLQAAADGPSAVPDGGVAPGGPWVPARDLVDGHSVLVPAAAAFAGLRGSDPGTASGLASGFSWAEAVCRGMADQAARMAVERFEATGGTVAGQVPRVCVEAVNDPAVERLRRMLGTARHEYAVYDVTGDLQAPTFAFCAGPRTVAWVADLHVARALATGLRLTVLDYQARHNGQLAYCPAAPDLPAARRGGHTAAPQPTAVVSWDDEQDRWCALFDRQGLRPVAVRLDHDPAVAAVLPDIVAVLLVSYG